MMWRISHIYELPAGYRFRMFREGDDVTWTDLHVAAEPYIQVTPALFIREYGSDRDALPDRMFFVETDSGGTRCQHFGLVGA